MGRRHFFHIDLVDLYDDGQLRLAASEQADALRYDEEWSALYLDGERRGRMRTVRVGQQRVEMVAEMTDPRAQLPPFVQISRVRIVPVAPHDAAVDKFTVMVRPQLDRTEEC